MDYTVIIQAVVTLIVALISYFVIPWLKANKTQKQIDTWAFWVDVAVAAAEQIFKSDQWSEKKQYVVNYLKDKGITYDSATVNNMIESAVLKLHAQLKEGTGDDTKSNDTTNTNAEVSPAPTDTTDSVVSTQ